MIRRNGTYPLLSIAILAILFSAGCAQAPGGAAPPSGKADTPLGDAVTLEVESTEYILGADQVPAKAIVLRNSTGVTVLLGSCELFWRAEDGDSQPASEGCGEAGGQLQPGQAWRPPAALQLPTAPGIWTLEMGYAAPAQSGTATSKPIAISATAARCNGLRSEYQAAGACESDADCTTTAPPLSCGCPLVVGKPASDPAGVKRRFDELGCNVGLPPCAAAASSCAEAELRCFQGRCR